MSTIRNNHFSLFFAIFFLLCTFQIAKSQVCTFTLGPDRTACFGSPLDRILYAPNGMNKYYWNNVQGVSSYSVTSTGTYTCRVEVESGLNLIQNPDFNAGATGFTFAYINRTGISNGLQAEGTFAVTPNSSLVHNGFSTFFDHTVGTAAGSYMVVNGATSVTPVNIWCQNITVNTYTTYNFSAWAMTIVAANASELASLQFSINGSQIGSIFSPPLSTGQWSQFNATWFSSITTNANICITNQSNVSSGNDFGLDDISYKEMCVARDTIKLTVARPILNAGLDKIICKQDSVLLAATTNTTYSTVWSPTIGVSDPSILQPNVSPPNSTTYTITVTDVNSCTASDKVIVNIRPNSEFELGNDTTLCPGQLLHLQPTFSATYSQVTWNDNSTDPDLIVNATGKYYATSDRNGCKYSDTINVAYTNIPGFTLPADITTCITNAPINMSTGIVGRPDITYKWSSGENTNNISINASGTYIATITLGNCSEKDTINVTLNNPITFSLGPDTVLCPGTNLQLNSGTPSNITSWQNGQTGNNFNVTQAGTYTATVNNTCITQSSVRVAYETLPIIDLGADKIICESDSVELVVDPKGNTLLWNTGSTKNTIVVNDEGNYTVTVFTKHCKTVDTIAVQKVAFPVIELGNDTTICSNTEIILKVDNTNVDITWSDGSTSEYFIANKEGTYWCEITNNVCAPVYDTLVLSTKNCDCNVYIPNSFSPDNSGTNEQFGVYTICAISDFNLKVFNRWGDLLFETGDPAVKWDGTFRGKKLETGVYVYKVKFRPFDYSGKIPEIETRAGQIHILK